MSPWLIVFLVSVAAEDPLDSCRVFQKDAGCALHPADIVSASSGEESEVSCQATCAANGQCNFFTFFKFDARDSLCLSLTSCEETSTGCEVEQGCVLAISGPSSPSILEACCDEFKHEECDSEAPFMTVTEVEDTRLCQDICRSEISCSFFTLFINVCFLYAGCSSRSACGLCSSGPAYPSMADCPQDFTTPPPSVGSEALIMGGKDSIELITMDKSCEADLPLLPVVTSYAGAAVLGENIYYCGGQAGQTFSDACHTLSLASDGPWMTGARMTTTRSEFGMVAVGEKLYATGGRQNGESGNEGKHTSVESFHPATGWNIEEDMRMPGTRLAHCTVAIEDSVFVIGGFVNGYGSLSIMKFDLGQNSTREWISLTAMAVSRYYPACSVGQHDGHTGIFVSGGANMDGKGSYTVEKSVEFYIPTEDTWVEIHRMLIVRYEHTMAEIGGLMMVAGGISYSNGMTPAVEILNGTIWTSTANMTTPRARHASVNIPTSTVFCKS